MNWRAGAFVNALTNRELLRLNDAIGEEFSSNGIVYVPQGKYAQSFPSNDALNGVPVGGFGPKRDKSVFYWFNGSEGFVVFV
jgi:hypothetical protein